MEVFMNSRKIQSLMLLAFMLVTVWQFIPDRQANAQSPQAKKTVDCHPMADLHAQLLRRFSAMDRFGIRRMITSPYHLQHFVAENNEERETIAALEKGNYSVSFFLAGRSILNAKPDGETLDAQSLKFYLRRPLINPVLITKDARYEELPQNTELWDEARKAMQAFDKGSNHYDFATGAWQVAVMPVRATQNACLKCHDRQYEMVNGQVKAVSKRLKIGDPMGAVLYVYKSEK
jgi:hypothetical protein